MLKPKGGRAGVGAGEKWWRTYYHLQARAQAVEWRSYANFIMVAARLVRMR